MEFVSLVFGGDGPIWSTMDLSGCFVFWVRWPNFVYDGFCFCVLLIGGDGPIRSTMEFVVWGRWPKSDYDGIRVACFWPRWPDLVYDGFLLMCFLLVKMAQFRLRWCCLCVLLFGGDGPIRSTMEFVVWGRWPNSVYDGIHVACFWRRWPDFVYDGFLLMCFFVGGDGPISFTMVFVFVFCCLAEMAQFGLGWNVLFGGDGPIRSTMEFVVWGRWPHIYVHVYIHIYVYIYIHIYKCSGVGSWKF